MKGGKKPSGRISAEKAEKMSLAGENGRQQISHDIQRIQVIKGDQHVTKSSKMLQGQYVLMVHEVTILPFLGQTLIPAFKLLNFSTENQIQEQRFKVTSK
ncbi:uncharacterized protein LJ264_012199 isoform 2-T3 [Porphyrio hochstetteri]